MVREPPVALDVSLSATNAVFAFGDFHTMDYRCDRYSGRIDEFDDEYTIQDGAAWRGATSWRSFELWRIASASARAER